MPVQRVRRVIRKIDPWTVLKVSLLFNAMMALVFVLGTVVFWSVFVNAGIPERINELALLVGLENGISLEGPVYFRIVVLLAVIGTILLTAFFTLGAVIYNLISDLVGGVEMVVLEETTSQLAASTRPKVSLPTSGPKARPKDEGGAPQAKLPTVKPMRREPGELPRAPGDSKTGEERRTGT